MCPPPLAPLPLATHRRRPLPPLPLPPAQSGDIDLDELRTAIRAIKTSSDDAAVEQMIAIADEDGSGTIDFEEFKLLMSMRRRAPV